MTRVEDLTYVMDVWGHGKYTCYLESDDGEVIKLLASKAGMEIKNSVFTNKSSLFTSRNETMPKIKDVIFNPPATIVLWEDGTKTIVKTDRRYGDSFNPETGLAMAICKKALGNKGSFNDVFKKWIWDKKQ